MLALAGLDTACTKTETITLPGRVDTLVVQRPGHVDTLVIVRPDTVVVQHAETTYVQRPGRVDTVVSVQHDTTYVPRVDTLVRVAPPETTYVTRPDTVLVVTHDTVVVHDTVVHVDTIDLTPKPAWICLAVLKADTVFALSGNTTPYCDAGHLAPQYPGKVMVDAPGATITMALPAPQMARGLVLPAFWGR